MIILIDDERTFKSSVIQEEYTLFKNSVDAIKWLENIPSETIIDQLWFDHDLGMSDNIAITSIPFLRKLEEMCFFGKAPRIREVIVHTSNSVGGDEIEKSMKRYFTTHRVFAGTYLEVKENERD